MMDGHLEMLQGKKSSRAASLLIALHSVTTMSEQTLTVPLDNFSQFNAGMDNRESRDSKTHMNHNSSTLGRIETLSHSSTLPPEKTSPIIHPFVD